MNNIVDELKKVKVFYIATSGLDSKPKVRPFSSITEFEDHAYICTGVGKEVYKELEASPYIEISGMYDMGSWIRVSAKVIKDNRIEVQEAILKDPTGPSQLYKPGDGRLVTYKLEEIHALKYNFYSAPSEIKEK